MADIMKHVGTYGGKPCVVVFREVPNETDQCLIVESSSLEDVKHDDLMNVVQSLESQQGKDLSEVLARRQFTDGSNMLNDLHFTKKIIKVPVNMVMLTPLPNQSISLQEVNAEINKLDGGYTPPLNDLETPVMNPVPTVATPEGASEAEGLLVQAELMEQDAKVMLQEAEAKKTQAYELAPELAPKKGPGRPKKVVTE
tara:strand:- start:97 stop:690 length:594 start_codon:yes stop_codon:yes gene_type:complete